MLKQDWTFPIAQNSCVQLELTGSVEGGKGREEGRQEGSIMRDT
jgi:hypothetical protein